MNPNLAAPPATEINGKVEGVAGTYAVSADEFNGELVGSKSFNIAYLKGKVPSWVKVPLSVALPFGVFKNVLSQDLNKIKIFME